MPKLSTTMPAPTIVSTSTPKQVQLLSGELDACALVTTSEIENVLGVKTTGGKISYPGATACRYVTADSKSDEVLLTVIFTDETLRNEGHSYSASSWFQAEKKANLRISQIGEQKMQDIPNLGDKAYYKVGGLVDLYIFKNNIEYAFELVLPYSEESDSVDKLLSLAKLAISRTP